MDRTVTINAFEIGFAFTIIIGSYLYSIVQIDLDWLEIVLTIFLAGCVYLAYRFNRFVMQSRREVTRK